MSDIPTQDGGFIGWAIGIISTVFAGAIKWVRGDISKRVHKDTFQQYIDGQEKLMDAHTRNVEIQTESVLRAHERIDKINS